MVLAGGVQQLTIGDLRAGEVAGLTWLGNPAHLRSVAAALDRAAQGLEDYLVVRAPTGQPVAKAAFGGSIGGSIGRPSEPVMAGVPCPRDLPAGMVTES